MNLIIIGVVLVLVLVLVGTLLYFLLTSGNTKKSCPNNCSENGTCNSNGTCSCNKGYEGDSCSCNPCKGCDGNKTYSTGISWQAKGTFDDINSSTVGSAQECETTATKNNYKNWSYSCDQPTLNCNYGTVNDTSCTIKDDKFVSDITASTAPICSGCPLGVVNSPFSALCKTDDKCGNNSKCNHRTCNTSDDCINLGECVNGKCELGYCSKSGCKTTDDCIPQCCKEMTCSDKSPCPSGGTCIDGYKCCGGTDPDCHNGGGFTCDNGTCKVATITNYSCGMNNAFFPNIKQELQLNNACASKTIGNTCSVDFKDNGTLNGKCGRPTNKPNNKLSCYPEKFCRSVPGVTTVDNPKGSCVDADICFDTNCK